MKNLFAILSFTLIIASCSSDDNNESSNNDEINFTLNVNSSEDLSIMLIEILDDTNSVLETYIVENQSMTSLVIDKGVKFRLSITDEDGFTYRYNLIDNNTGFMLIDRGNACNVSCFTTETY